MPKYVTITVGFTTPPPTVTASPSAVSIDYGQEGTVQLDLKTSVAGAVFAEDPVRWDGATPPGAVVTRNSDSQAQITVTDDQKTTQSFSFQVQVRYLNETFLSPDPVIIEKGGP